MDIAVERFILSKKADGRADATIKDYRRVILPFVEWYEQAGLCLSELGIDDIRRYVAGLRARGWAAGHVAIHVRNLRCFLRWLFGEGYIKIELHNAVKRPKKTRRFESPIRNDEIKLLLGTCDDSLEGLRDKAIMLVLYDSGLRAGELLLLKSSHWHCDNVESSYLVVYAPKIGDSRFVPLGIHTSAALRFYVDRRGLAGDVPLFASVRGGGQLGYNGLVKMLRRRAGLAGIDTRRVHPHIFRKAFVTASLDNGMDAERVRVLAGWSSLEMLKIYTESDLTRLIEAHRRAGPVDRMFGQLEVGQ